MGFCPGSLSMGVGKQIYYSPSSSEVSGFWGEVCLWLYQRKTGTTYANPEDILLLKRKATASQDSSRFARKRSICRESSPLSEGRGKDRKSSFLT